MRIMIIGYEGEPASAFSSIYLGDIIKACGCRDNVMTSTCLISHQNGGAIIEGMFKTAVKNIRPDVVISINVPRFCFDSEFAAVKTFITWIQDWNIWMNPETAKLWNDSLGIYNDWMIGYVNLPRGFDDSRKIYCPYLMPFNPIENQTPEFDVVAPMNKGMGWRHWWEGPVCQEYLKEAKIDGSYMSLALPRVASLIASGDLGVLDCTDSIVHSLGPAGMKWMESLPKISNGRDGEWFKRVVLENGIIASMFRTAAIENLTDGMQRGNGTYNVAGLGWEWASSHTDYLSPQHVQSYMTRGKYVLHVSHGSWGHHRTALAFMSGRMPIVLSKTNARGRFGNVRSFLRGQEIFMRRLIDNLPEGRPCPDFPMEEVECLGTPARITMEGLKNFKQWEKEYAS